MVREEEMDAEQAATYRRDNENRKIEVEANLFHDNRIYRRNAPPPRRNLNGIVYADVMNAAEKQNALGRPRAHIDVGKNTQLAMAGIYLEDRNGNDITPFYNYKTTLHLFLTKEKKISRKAEK